MGHDSIKTYGDMLVEINTLNLDGWNTYGKTKYNPKIQIGMYELDSVFTDSLKITNDIIMGLQKNARLI